MPSVAVKPIEPPPGLPPINGYLALVSKGLLDDGTLAGLVYEMPAGPGGWRAFGLFLNSNGVTSYFPPPPDVQYPINPPTLGEGTSRIINQSGMLVAYVANTNTVILINASNGQANHFIVGNQLGWPTDILNDGSLYGWGYDVARTVLRIKPGGQFSEVAIPGFRTLMPSTRVSAHESATVFHGWRDGDDSSRPSHAVLCRNGALTDLGCLVVLDVNDHGDVVGMPTDKPSATIDLTVRIGGTAYQVLQPVLPGKWATGQVSLLNDGSLIGVYSNPQTKVSGLYFWNKENVTDLSAESSLQDLRISSVTQPNASGEFGLAASPKGVDGLSAYRAQLYP